MKRLKEVMFLMLLVVPIFSYGQLKGSNKSIVVIDPGHGGSDSGALGVNGIQEKDVVLNIAKELVRLNKKLYSNTYEIYLTRYTDTLISLKDRGVLAKKLRANIFISLHCNHSSNPNARGIEVYVANNGKHIRQSIFLGYQLQKGLREQIGYKSRGVKFANFQVLRETVDYCPAVLLEIGFLSNWKNYKYYQMPESIKALALVTLESLKGYERVSD
ncbi:N-acetylmuramoyl-L-alanine amidase [Leeuwenhoekiella sp. MAR_2009_132]|uniref:N-acetylmuramoyl-L-alanine amidase family protein n=1 Tax=Leeuwenhoekiella sp. MAR_2009_132 TaxID=1392489 RepID=UPI00048A6C72|nr:N-acetylmuramoyl-L-alanine amidase [Leeuwenhoekiella sp. MAR_2009_132]